MPVSSSIKNVLRRARHRVNQAIGRDVRVPIQVRCNRELLGTDYGGWCVCPDKIGPDNVVYSFGVGQDISWDLAMIERFGVTVHAFDPTPKSIEWIAQQRLPENFDFHEYGIADYDGTAHFALPNPDFVSFSMTGQGGHGGAVPGRGIEVDAPVHRLTTIMQKLGHDKIDVLKMDIEGAEIPVVADLAKSKVQIAQILVEFHHHVGNADEVRTTRRAIETLHAMGFRLFHNSAVGKEFSFLRVP
jgi:FkbM family methyltransferase